MKQTQERVKGRVQLNIKDAPYEKVVRIMNLFIEPYTYNLIELFNSNDHLNYDEIIAKTSGSNAYTDVDNNLSELVREKIIKKKQKTYTLNVPVVKQVNDVLRTLGKNARDISPSKSIKK